MEPNSGALAQIASVAPRVHSALLRAWQAAIETVDPPLFAAARRRVEAEHRFVPDHGERTGTTAARASELAAQFVVYVPGVGEDLLGPVRERVGAHGLRSLVEAMYLLDQTARLRISHARLFMAAESPAPPVDLDDLPPLTEAIAAFHSEVMSLKGLDPLTTEIARLRCADHHACRG